MRRIEFIEVAEKDFLSWSKRDKRIHWKIEQLLVALAENPFMGIGKPEQLKHHLSGLWSRRINQEHRLIYEVTDDEIIIHSCFGHYLK